MFRRFFGGSKSAYDLNSHAAALSADLLRRIPRCTAAVVIAGPELDPAYRCSVVVGTGVLSDWATSSAPSVASGDIYFKAAHLALPAWLSSADNHDGRASHLPRQLYPVVEAYVANFVNQSSCQILCPDCQSFHQAITTTRTDGSFSGGWSRWHVDWHCPQGHFLYGKDHEAHFLVR